MSDAHRTYSVRFNGRPSIVQMQQELASAAKAISEYTRVAIETNGSSDPELEEVTFTMETD